MGMVWLDICCALDTDNTSVHPDDMIVCYSVGEAQFTRFTINRAVDELQYEEIKP